MMFLKAIYFAFLRMLREPLGHILLIVVPLCVILIMGLMFGEGSALISYMAEAGLNKYEVTFVEYFTISMVLAMQLFGGAYAMSYIADDLLYIRKWRMYSLPFGVHRHAFSILIASTFFSAMQGLVMVLVTYWIFGVNWGNFGWVLLVLLAVSLLSQIVCLLFVFTINNFKIAERLSEVYGFSSMIFAGMFFSLPDHPFFTFMSIYGNPISLGRTAIFGMTLNRDTNQIFLSMGILIAVTVVLALAVAWLGRRKLA